MPTSVELGVSGRRIGPIGRIDPIGGCNYFSMKSVDSGSATDFILAAKIHRHRRTRAAALRFERDSE